MLDENKMAANEKRRRGQRKEKDKKYEKRNKEE
jgi:hypothetical protein